MATGSLIGIGVLAVHIILIGTVLYIVRTLRATERQAMAAAQRDRDDA